MQEQQKMVESTVEVDSWVNRLRSPDEQEAALTELRTILMRGLRKVFHGKGGGESFCDDIAQEALIRKSPR